MGAVWVLDTAAWVFKASEKKKTNKQTKEELDEKWNASHFLPDFFQPFSRILGVNFSNF